MKILQLEDEAKTNGFLILTFYKSEDFYVLILHTFSDKLNISEGKKLFEHILSSVKLKWK